MNFFFFVAEELRELMAQIGIRKFDDLIGRADLLDMKKGHRALEGAGLDLTAASSTSPENLWRRPFPERHAGPRSRRRSTTS